jgi:uncharacterized membrane protein
MVENKKLKSSKTLSELHTTFTTHLGLTITSLGLLAFINSQNLKNVYIINLCIISFALIYTAIGLADFIDGFYNHLDKNVKKHLSTWDKILSYIYMVLGFIMFFVIVVISIKLFKKNSL